MDISQKVINYSEFNFQESTVIKPKMESFHEQSIASVKIPYVISSIERNKQLYPTPSKYVIELPSDVQDVMGFELITTNIRFNPYNVRKNNNLFTITCGTTKAIELTPGTYTMTTLKAEMTTKLADEFPTENFVVEADPITSKIKLINDSLFSIENSYLDGSRLLYPPHHITKLLGFGCKTYTSEIDSGSGKHVLESEYAADVFEDIDTIIIHIESMQVNMGISSIVNKSYALLHKSNYETTSREIKKRFNPPLARMSKIAISFYDGYGDLYDFQNRDHIMEFVLELHKHTRKYMVYTAD
jgi:hypothetical protein